MWIKEYSESRWVVMEKEQKAEVPNVLRLRKAIRRNSSAKAEINGDLLSYLKTKGGKVLCLQ